MTDVEAFIREPLMSGHCNFPQTRDPEVSHARCKGGQRANPQRTYQPCGCDCHLGEEFECGGCGGVIREAPLWPLDSDGDARYTHIDPETGRATGEDC